MSSSFVVTIAIPAPLCLSHHAHFRAPRFVPINRLPAQVKVCDQPPAWHSGGGEGVWAAGGAPDAKGDQWKGPKPSSCRLVPRCKEFLRTKVCARVCYPGFCALPVPAQCEKYEKEAIRAIRVSCPAPAAPPHHFGGWHKDDDGWGDAF